MERSEKAGLAISVAAHAALLAVLSLGLLAPKPLPPKPVSDPIDIQFADETGLVSGAPEPAVEVPAQSEAPELGKPEEAAAAQAEPAPPAPRPKLAPPPPEPDPAPVPRPRATPVQPPVPTPRPEPTPKPVSKPVPAPRPVPRPVPKPVVKPVAKPTPAEPTAKPAPVQPAPARTAPTKVAPTNATAGRPAKTAAAKTAPSDARSSAGNGRPAPGKSATATARAGAGTGAKTAGAALGDDFLKGITADRSDSRAQAPRAATVSASQMARLVGAIQRQFKPCADRRSNPGPGSERIVTRLHLRYRMDGTLIGVPVVEGQVGKDDENSRYATRVGEQAVGIARECSPLKLPPELYEVGNGQGWNDIVIRYKLPG